MEKASRADIKDYDLRAISLGAGVQSSCVYIMSCVGELTPTDVAIFCDTQAEPPWVYDHLDWLEKNFSHIVPIKRCTGGNIEKDLYWQQGKGKGFVQIPAHLARDDGSRGIGRRQCTRVFKIDPIKKEIRSLLGLSKGQHAAGRFKVQQWIGISLDEIQRAKPSQDSWIDRHYPLIHDRPTDRAECLHWMRKNSYKIPKKSSCYFCPYHDDHLWRDLRETQPDLFARAVKIDNELREQGEQQFLHRGCKPLGETKFKDEDQLDLWTNECEGVCGV